MKLWKALFLLVIFFVIATKASAASDRRLSVLLMPLQNISEEDAPFTIDNNPYPNLKFDNPDDDWKNLGIGHQKWLCDQLMEFSRTHNNLKIAVRFIPWDQALNDLKSLYELYDVVQVPSTWTANLIDKGMLTKWEDDFNSSVYPSEILKTCRIQKHHDFYAVPWQLDIRVLFYRAELTDDSNQLNTFSGFRKCLERRKDVTGRAPFCIATDRDWDILHNTLRYFWIGRIIDKKCFSWWRPVFNDDKAFEGLEELYNLHEKGLVHFASFKGLQSWYGQAQGLAEGQYDALFGGFYEREVFDKHPEADIRVAPLPVPEFGTSSKKTFLGGSHLAVTTSSIDRDSTGNARDLIKWLTKDKTEIEMFKQTNAIPARLDALKEFFIQNPRWQFDINSVFQTADVYPSIPAWAELENDVVLGNFHNIVRNIASGQSWQVVELHVKNASEKVANILFADWLHRVLPVIILVLAISTAMTAWLFWDKIRIKYFKVKAEKRVNDLTAEVQEAKEEILREIRKSELTLQNKLVQQFDEANRNLKEVYEDVKVFAHTSMSAENHHHQSSELFSSLKILESQFDSIQSQLPDSSTITQIIQLLEEIRILIENVKDIEEKKVYPDNIKVPLHECQVIANFLYEQPNVTLEIKLCHPNLENKSIKEWESHETPLLFELLALRMWDSDKFLKKTNLYYSDYYAVDWSYLHNWSSAFERFTEDKAKDNIRRMYGDIRSEVFDFFNHFCLMENKKGKIIKAQDFMLKAHRQPSPPQTFSHGQPDEDENGWDIRNISDEDAHRHIQFAHPTQPSEPPYEFILPMQVASFKCNIIETATDSKNNPKPSANHLCEMLIHCPRCLPAWVELASCGLKILKTLDPRHKEFIKEMLIMLKSEVQRYRSIAKTFTTYMGGELLLGFNEVPDLKIKELNSRIDSIEDIIEKLEGI